MKNLVFASIVLFFIACSTEPPVPPSVSGTVTGGGTGESLYLEQLTPNDVISRDTAVIGEDGSFLFDYHVKSIGFYRIKQTDKKFITLIVDSNDQINVNAEWEIGITPYTVTGSEETNRLVSLNKNTADVFRKRDSLNQVFQTNQGNTALVDELREAYNYFGEKHTEYVKGFIDEAPGSFANLAAAEQLNPDQYFEYYNKIDKAMAESYGDTEYYEEFHKMVERLGKLAIGSEAPDILLPNPEGKVVPLSSLRGNVVLVDFWASWCKPCRRENPVVVEAYERFNDKGFEVYGVSLDRSREEWLRAIEKDNLHWTQVSDLQFWNSAVVKLYDIEGIPFALLLDKDGKIIAKNLRGEALIRKLEKILN